MRHPVSGRASGGFQRKARINMHEDHLYGCHPGPLCPLALPPPMATDRRFTTQHVINILSILDIRSFSIYTRAIPSVSYRTHCSIRLYNIPDRSFLTFEYLRISRDPISNLV